MRADMASQKDIAALLASQGGQFSPIKKRAYLYPIGRDADGKIRPAVPQFVYDIAEAMMAPGKVLKDPGLMINPETGRTSDYAIQKSADLAGMMTLGAGAIPAEANSLRMGIKAYHGSPHDFDRFDMSKIGTGEGAQAKGHGLYFAENEGVAKFYRDALSTRTIDGNPANWKKPEHIAAGWLEINKGDKEATVKYLTSIPQAYQTPETKAAVDLLKSGASLPDVSPGRMYEVNINADPNDFLDWDKPLREQPTNVQQAVERLMKKDKASWTEADQHLYDMLEGLGVSDIYDPMANIKGEGAYQSLENSFGRTGAVEKLRNEGIPGIKYLDAGSRGAGDGSRNYVVFDDKLISIVKKYGVAALVSAGVISQQQGEELKAQGYN